MIEYLVRRLEIASMALSGICVFLLMLVISYDAIWRYAFNDPKQWASELSINYLMIIAIYGALSSTFSSGDHINIDLFQRAIPKPVQARIEAVYCLMAAIVFCLIAYAGWSNILNSYRNREFIPGFIMWPLWISFLPIMIGSALLTIRLVLHSWKMAIHGADPDVASSHVTEGIE